MDSRLCLLGVTDIVVAINMPADTSRWGVGAHVQPQVGGCWMELMQIACIPDGGTATGREGSS